MKTINNNITEDYCSFELSKLLKEKGFDIYCDSFYNDTNGKLEKNVGNYNSEDQDEEANHSSRPTHAVAIKWIRENFKISISSTISTSGKGMYEIWQDKGDAKGWNRIKSDYGFNSATQASDVALIYTLKNLI